MATTTTNFGWDIPQSTDLVKDGATAIAALGQDIDTALIDLKGGTSGQVLAKASGTDLDFSWVAQDDSNAIQNAIVDAKGDLIAATAADTPARLAVGTNGQVLTADSTTATGLAWGSAASGGITLIASGTLASGGTTVSSIPSTYNSLLVYIQNFRPNTDGYLKMRFNSDATANRWAEVTTYPEHINVSFNQDSSFITTANDSAVSQSLSMITIPNYANTTSWKIVNGLSANNNGTTTTNLNYKVTNYVWNQTSAINALTFFASTASISAGTYEVYGVK